jgi:hypothetical protein
VIQKIRQEAILSHLFDRVLEMTTTTDQYRFGSRAKVNVRQRWQMQSLTEPSSDDKKAKFEGFLALPITKGNAFQTI